MKFVLRDLKLGMHLTAIVEEILSQDEILMNFQGDLLRASNATARPLKLGEQITVVVRALNPLSFQLIDEHEAQSARRGRLDLSV